MTDCKGVNIRSKRSLQTLLLVFLMSQWYIILIKKSNLLSKRNNEINIQNGIKKEAYTNTVHTGA